MNKKVLIYGAGGHTRSLIPLLLHNNYEIDGIIDNSYIPETPEIISGYKLLGNEDYFTNAHAIVISIGDNNKRELIFNKYQALLIQENLIHPTSIIEKDVILGRSNQIFAIVFIV